VCTGAQTSTLDAMSHLSSNKTGPCGASCQCSTQCAVQRACGCQRVRPSCPNHFSILFILPDQGMYEYCAQKQHQCADTYSHEQQLNGPQHAGSADSAGSLSQLSHCTGGGLNGDCGMLHMCSAESMWLLTSSYAPATCWECIFLANQGCAHTVRKSSTHGAGTNHTVTSRT
jgi:hypothetical protein